MLHTMAVFSYRTGRWGRLRAILIDYALASGNVHVAHRLLTG